ncbi:hypothetical protein ZIOFF_033918 [Zingiber officinale]|uniref:Uncharacterized protein n=1 Tax=Zingiber officinale TaxID=94328 RepID=A0A8J5GK82_ZINOF|nr:hypothetical protein ZIOFF_033918 [Zingiber officinale]
MNLPTSSTSKEYLEALESTEAVSNPAIGFIFAKGAGVKDINRRNNTIIELLLSINAKLDLLIKKPVDSNNQVADLAKQLKGLNLGKNQDRVYQHYSETRILVTEGQQNLLLINPESYAVLRQEGFRYNIQNVANYLASTGINVVPSTPRTTTELQGMRWILQPPLVSQVRNPQYPEIWDTLGEPSGSTPWEDDPEWDIDELPEPPPEPEIQEYEEEEEDPETYFLRQKGKAIMIEDNDNDEDQADKEFVPFLPGKEVADLAKQLEGLNLGKVRTKKPEPFFVYKDPLKILKEEKEKLKKDELKDIQQEADVE